MNRDHFLFLLIGALFGFIAGYVAHETMAARQPAAFWAGTAGPAAAAMAQQSASGAPIGTPNPNPAAQQQAPQAGGSPQAAMERVQALRARVDANPDDLDAVRELANMHYDIANWLGAAELYEQYLVSRPDDANVLTDLGACYRNLGRLDDALEIFARTRASNPEHWQAYYNEILITAFDKGDLAAAVPVLEALEALQPGNADVERLGTEVRRRLGS